MRKIFISAFSAIMAISLSAVSVLAKTYTDVTENSLLGDAVGRLSDLGIITGYDDGTFRPDSNISRAEACAMFSRMLPQRISSVASLDMSFSDVDNTTWSYEYVNEMAALQIVNGYDDNTFKPQNNITYQEFIKMVMSMLFYQPYAEENGGYPAGYLTAAEKNGITADMSFENESSITREDAAIMVSRMLSVPILKVQEYNVNGANTYNFNSDITYEYMLTQ